jgi:hypothetical protein
MLPEGLDLPKADDEVDLLLGQYQFQTPQGHLDQGIAAHARGEWGWRERSISGLHRKPLRLDRGATRLRRGASIGNSAKTILANRMPAFFQAELNEWTGQGQGFLEGFFKRLHPGGAHPGLSDGTGFNIPAAPRASRRPLAAAKNRAGVNQGLKMRA